MDFNCSTVVELSKHPLEDGDASVLARLSGPVKKDPTSNKIKLGLPSRFYECEVTFAIPIAIAKAVVERENLVRGKILQAYFPKECIGPLAAAAIKHGYAPELFTNSDLTSVRTRREKFSDSNIEYAVQFKGPKANLSSGIQTRLEIPIPIVEKSFERVLPEATQGALGKTRFYRPGFIEPKGERIPLTAQIDFIKQLGPLRDGRPRFDVRGIADFVLIDFELPNVALSQQRELMERLRSRFHTFSFLKYGVELSVLDPDLQASFSARRLAQYGFQHPDFKRAHKELLKLFKARNSR